MSRLSEWNEEVTLTKKQLLDILVDYFGEEEVLDVYEAVLNSIDYQEYLNIRDQDNG